MLQLIQLCKNYLTKVMQVHSYGVIFWLAYVLFAFSFGLYFGWLFHSSIKSATEVTESVFLALIIKKWVVDQQVEWPTNRK